MRSANCISFRYRVKGQAILELAIFGSILILLLGVLLNYGLKYSYQQQMMQYAFRRALLSAGGNSPDPTTQMVLRDRHISSSTDVFSVGSVTPFGASAAIVRSNMLDQTPDNDEEMPKVAYDVASGASDRQVNTYTMAGFNYNSDEQGYDLKKAKRRYEEVYGANTFWRIDDGENPLDWDTGEPVEEVQNVNNNKGGFARFTKWLKEHFPAKHPTAGVEDEEPPFAVKIMDDCNGQIVGYDDAVRQCRLVVDDEVCLRSCVDGGGTDCGEACSHPIPPPWYCLGAVETNPANHIWFFPKLKELFFPERTAQERDKAPTWSMGLQGDSVHTMTFNNRLDTKESSEKEKGITNVDTFQWDAKTDRKIFYIENEGRKTQNVQTKVPQDKTRTWQTPW